MTTQNPLLAYLVDPSLDKKSSYPHFYDLPYTLIDVDGKEHLTENRYNELFPNNYFRGIFKQNSEKAGWLPKTIEDETDGNNLARLISIMIPTPSRAPGAYAMWDTRTPEKFHEDLKTDLLMKFQYLLQFPEIKEYYKKNTEYSQYDPMNFLKTKN